MNKSWVIIKTSKKKYTINMDNIMSFTTRVGQTADYTPEDERYYEIELEGIFGIKLFLSFHKKDAKLYRGALSILHNALFNTKWQNEMMMKHQIEVLNNAEEASKENQ